MRQTPVTRQPMVLFGESGSSTAHYSDVSVMDNVSAVEGANVAGSVNLIQTLSYTTPTDGGGGVYRRVTGPSDVQSLDGAWWEIVPQGQLYAVALGVFGDASYSGVVWSGTDQEPKIKDALYRHVYELKGSAVELPIGTMIVGRGLHVGYGEGLSMGRLKGSGKVMGYQNFPGTSLIWNFTDEPLISIQCARNTIVEDIGFSGPGLKYIVDSGMGLLSYVGVADDTLLATWVDPAWPAQASSRYAPAAMIAVDPRVGPPSPSSPTSKYRDVDYPAVMGGVGQYNKGISSGVTLQNLDVYGGGMVAFVVHPNENSDGNGDFVRIKDSRITWMPVGLSVCQTQGRLTLLDSVDFAVLHTAITTNMHGKRQGVFAEARNCAFSGIQIFDLGDTAISGHIHINTCYAEELWRIGTVNTTTAVATKLLITQSRFSFENQTDNRGVPATLLGGTSGIMPLEINGGAWVNYFGAAVIDHSITGVTINGLMLEPRPPTTMQEKCFHNGTAGGLIFPQLGIYLPIENIHPKFVTWNLDTGAEDNTRMMGKRWRSNRTICTPLWAERHCAETLRDEGVMIPDRVDAAIAGSTFTSASLSGLTLTTTWGGRSDQDYMLHGPLPGDILYHTVSRSVFVCMTANTTTDVVTFKLVNNYRDTTPRNPIDLATDTICYMAPLRYYSPATPIYGIITSGSAVITDAGSIPHGGGTQVALYLNPDIAVGDWLIVDPSLAPYLNPSWCNVTAIDETAKTITLGNVLAGIGSSTTRVRLGTFVRTPVA